MTGGGEARFQVTVEPDLQAWPEPVYANWVSMARTPHDLTLHFSQVQLPLVPPEEMDGDMRVVATPVARAIVPLSVLPNLLEGLQQQLQEIQAAVEQTRAEGA